MKHFQDTYEEAKENQSMSDYETHVPKHFNDENYDSMKDYEFNLLKNPDDYKDGDYYDKPIINYEK